MNHGDISDIISSINYGPYSGVKMPENHFFLGKLASSIELLGSTFLILLSSCEVQPCTIDSED